MTTETTRQRGHDWHTFDELLGYDVRRIGDVVEIRTADERIVALDLAEFNALRGTGPKPRGLQ